MEKVAVLGLGTMGGRMAAHLLAAGHPVVVWNRSAEKAAPLVGRGAVLASTPRAAAEGADIVLAIVRDDMASRQVWLDTDTGAVQGLAAGAVAIESSTLTPVWVRELANAMTAAGRTFLDAPVSGSVPQADAAQLVFLVGGEAEAVQRVTPVLLRMGRAVKHAGPIGAGATLKLGVNALLAIQAASLGELIGFYRRAGLDMETAIAAMGETPAASPAAKAFAALMLADDREPRFKAELMAKDLTYATGTAEATGATLPVTQTVLGLYERLVAQGHGADNLTSISTLFD